LSRGNLVLLGKGNGSKTYEIKEFLNRNLVDFLYFEVGLDPEAQPLIEKHKIQNSKYPVLVFDDGYLLEDPDLTQVANAVGLHSIPKDNYYDLIIFGMGPAGLASAIYAGSEGLKTLVIEMHSPGGRAGSTSMIENLIAHPDGITGAEFSERSRKQAEKFGVEFVVPVVITDIIKEDDRFIVSLSSGVSISGHALVIAVGVRYRLLEVPGVEKFLGSAIFYGSAMTEGKRNEGKEVFVVGGANSAGQAAMYFSRFAKKVNLVVRGESISKRMSHYLVEEIHDRPNIEVMTQSEIIAINGEEKLESLEIKNTLSGITKAFPADDLFLLIGGQPNVDGLASRILRDQNGFIVTGSDLEKHERFSSEWTISRRPLSLETNIPGIFAIGDVRANTAKRMAAAIGDGANVINQVAEYYTFRKLKLP
jgi:thioredoxin reductase (NADPH)